jgi:hypothetical protein
MRSPYGGFSISTPVSAGGVALQGVGGLELDGILDTGAFGRCARQSRSCGTLTSPAKSVHRRRVLAAPSGLASFISHPGVLQRA